MATNSSHDSQRKEALKILSKYPGRLPVVCLKGSADSSILAALPDQKKFLVPSQMSCDDFKDIVRKHIRDHAKVDIKSELQLFVGSECVDGGMSMQAAYDQHKAEDCFLYVAFSFADGRESGEQPEESRRPRGDTSKDARKLLAKHPNTVPVVCERATGSDAPALSGKNRFLVPCSMLCSEFKATLQKQFAEPFSGNIDAITLSVGDQVLDGSSTMAENYSRHGAPDGFLYANYDIESPAQSFSEDTHLATGRAAHVEAHEEDNTSNIEGDCTEMAENETRIGEHFIMNECPPEISDPCASDTHHNDQSCLAGIETSIASEIQPESLDVNLQNMETDSNSLAELNGALSSEPPPDSSVSSPPGINHSEQADYSSEIKECIANEDLVACDSHKSSERSEQRRSSSPIHLPDNDPESPDLSLKAEESPDDLSAGARTGPSWRCPDDLSSVVEPGTGGTQSSHSVSIANQDVQKRHSTGSPDGPAQSVRNSSSDDGNDIMSKFPGRVPVLCKKGAVDAPNISRSKFLVPVGMTCSEFKYMIYQQLTRGNGLGVTDTIYLFVNKDVSPKSCVTMGELHGKYKAEDSFLHVTYSVENTLGRVLVASDRENDLPRSRRLDYF